MLKKKQATRTAHKKIKYHLVSNIQLEIEI